MKPMPGLRQGKRVFWSDGEWVQEAASTPTQSSRREKKTEGRIFRSPSPEVKSQRSVERWDTDRLGKNALQTAEETTPEVSLFVQENKSRNSSKTRFRHLIQDVVRSDLGLLEKNDDNGKKMTHFPEEAGAAQRETPVSQSANNSAMNLMTNLTEVERAIARYKSHLRLALERGEPVPLVTDQTPEPLLHLAASLCDDCSRHLEPFFRIGPGAELTQSSLAKDLIAFLVDLPGTDVNARDSKGMTSLHAAVKVGSLWGVRGLVEAGGDITLEEFNGNSPLHLAALSDASAEVVHALLESETAYAAPRAIDCKNKEGLSPLHLAVQRNNASLVQALTVEGADVAAVDFEGHTPLHHAALCSADEDVFSALLRSPFLASLTTVVNAVNSRGQTALHLAVAGNRPEVMSLLLSEGADVTIPDQNGDTPFHEAVRQDVSAEMVEVLISSAPAPAVRRAFAMRNKQRLTALQMAVRRSRTRLVNILKARTSQVHVELDTFRR